VMHDNTHWRRGSIEGVTQVWRPAFLPAPPFLQKFSSTKCET
jgi:hypothetical protein